MRTTLTCRSCNSRKLWRVNPVMLPEFDSKNAIYPFPAVCRSSSGTTETHGWGKKQEHGQLEAWICATCGLTEWYAVDVNQALAQLCQIPGSGVSYVDGDAQPPYR